MKMLSAKTGPAVAMIKAIAANKQQAKPLWPVLIVGPSRQVGHYITADSSRPAAG
jgi:hypothetical protein